MNKYELAKDFVLAFINNGSITTPSQAVQTYYDIINMLERNEPEAHTSQSEPYEPFKGL